MQKTGKKEREYWFVYILECENGSLYTGFTADLARRYEEHLKGKGFKIERSDVKNDAGTMGSLSAKLEDRREVHVTAVPAEKETQVSVHYASRGD